MSPLKKKRLIPINKLLKLCHAAWSICVRLTDKACVMCHSTENLHAHHCVVPKSKGAAVRFFLDNGITLCYRCHMMVVHKGLERKNWFDRLKEIIDSRVPAERQAEIIRLSHEPKKWTREELTSTLDTLKRIAQPSPNPPIV